MSRNALLWARLCEIGWFHWLTSHFFLSFEWVIVTEGQVLDFTVVYTSPLDPSLIHESFVPKIPIQPVRRTPSARLHTEPDFRTETVVYVR